MADPTKAEMLAYLKAEGFPDSYDVGLNSHLNEKWKERVAEKNKPYKKAVSAKYHSKDTIKGR
jgi:hypothetical protein